MSARSSSQVNNLRAMFELNKETTSPPSRGRSPADPESLLGNNPRPISKVRTSFVAVERSGQMGPSIDAQKPNTHGEATARGVDGGDPKLAGNTITTETSKSQGNGIMAESSKAETENESVQHKDKDVNGLSQAEAPVNDSTRSPMVNDDNAASGDLAMVTIGEADNRPKSDLEGEKGTEDGLEPCSNVEDLGVVMKGASFEQEEGNSDTVRDSKTNQLKNVSSPNQTQSPTDTKTGPSKQGNAAGNSASLKTKPATSRPSAITTKKSSAPASANRNVSGNGLFKKSPKTPTSPNVSNRQLSSKTASPRQPFSPKTLNNTDKETKKAPIQKSERSSTIAKAPAAAVTRPGRATSSTVGKAAKKSGPTSPTTKSRPKSPTRPVRLPAGATASTASSAARIGDAPLPRSPGRTSASNAIKTSTLHKDKVAGASRDPALGTAVNPRKKSTRPSLPASATNKNPKPRVSTSSTKAPEGSFLARMMRPTQSSASKTHEKIEHTSPPSKSQSSKPKRKSNGTDDGKGDTEGESQPASLPPDEEQTVTPSAENADETANHNGVTSTEIDPV